jgi:Kef-type K+ transport system membrane component KefB
MNNLLINSYLGIIIAIIIAIVTSHAFEILMKNIGSLQKWSQEGGFILFLEAIIIIVLCYLTLHSYLSEDFDTGHNVVWYHDSLIFLFLLLFFFYGSWRIYKWDRSHTSSGNP